MSILKKSSLTLAIAMAMGFGLATPAMATVFVNTSTPSTTQVAYTTVVGGSANISSQTYEVDIQPSDNQVGRTTGFNALLTLSGTATFTTTPTVNVGTADAGWTVAVVAGGAGTNFIQVTVSPPSGGQIVTNTSVITLTGVQLSNAGVLASPGGVVTISGSMHDANTGFAVGTPFSGPIVASADPLLVTYNLNGYYPNSRIDVGTGKIGFSDFGMILPATATPDPIFDAGSVTINSVTGLLDASNSTPFVFNSTTDKFATTLQGSFGTAFGPTAGSIQLQDNCFAAAGSTTVRVVGGVTPSSATFNYTLSNLSSTTLPVTEHVCFAANGTDVILPTAVNAGTTVDAGIAQSGALMPLQYNGSVAFVPTFNPAGNTVQQSFLRVINPSTVSGKVTIVGTDDSGHVSGPVTFNLPAGQAMQLNGDLLTNGGPSITGSLGTSTGKWRLDVTGEFDNMRVQSLVRNNTTGTVTNLSGEVVDSTGLMNSSVRKINFP
jgi:hypothetical protein